MGRVRTACILAFAALALAAAPAAALASPFDPSGIIRLVKHPHPGLSASQSGGLNASQSGNWFGYDEGALERGKLFTSISADWTVPAASQHTKKQAEESATWIGIGGGCLDTSCLITDASGLIQTGTEQDVGPHGRASYSAWWELVPFPAVPISMKVGPGDRIHASVVEIVRNAGLWRITLKDLSRHESFTRTTPYPSSNATAEWIEETPLTITGSGVGQGSLPRLTETPFDNARVNGAPAGLRRSEEIDLAPGPRVIARPSAPDGGHDGFGDCTWTATCPVPPS